MLLGMEIPIVLFPVLWVYVVRLESCGVPAGLKVTLRFSMRSHAQHTAIQKDCTEGDGGRVCV